MERYSIKEKNILIFALNDSIADGEHSRQILTDREGIDQKLNQLRSLRKKLKEDIKKTRYHRELISDYHEMIKEDEEIAAFLING